MGHLCSTCTVVKEFNLDRCREVKELAHSHPGVTLHVVQCSYYTENEQRGGKDAKSKEVSKVRSTKT